MAHNHNYTGGNQPQGLGTDTDFPNSSNNVVAYHYGKTDSVKEDPNEVDSDKHAPKIPNNHNSNYSIFGMFYLELIIESIIHVLLLLVLITCLTANFILNVVLIIISLFLLRLNH